MATRTRRNPPIDALRALTADPNVVEVRVGGRTVATLPRARAAVPSPKVSLVLTVPLSTVAAPGVAWKSSVIEAVSLIAMGLELGVVT